MTTFCLHDGLELLETRSKFETATKILVKSSEYWHLQDTTDRAKVTNDRLRVYTQHDGLRRRRVRKSGTNCPKPSPWLTDACGTCLIQINIVFIL